MATYGYTKYIDDDRLALEIRNSAITIALDEVVITGEETVDVIFKADLPENDKLILDDLILAHINQPITVRDSVDLANVDITSNAERAIKMAPTKLEGSSTQLFSHDFCDKTTWYGESLKKDQVLTSQDNLIFKGSETFWIYLVHGNVPHEDRIATDYATVIRVDGAILTTGYSIDYAKGEVTFDQAQTGVVTAVYNHAVGSSWSIKPKDGRILKIIGTTVKFTSDVELLGQSIDMQLFIGGNPMGEIIRYKNVKDLMKCSTASPSKIQGFGDVLGEVNFLPFDYLTSKDLKSSLLMEIKIWLSQDKECNGEFGVVVADCLSLLGNA